MVTWQDVLDVVRVGRQTIPTATSGIPLIAVNAPFYELMQLMEAMTTGYNAQVRKIADLERKIEQIRKLARAQFPNAKRDG